MKTKLLVGLGLAVVLAFGIVAITSAVSGAAFTTYNPSVDGKNLEVCKNSIINCNIYGAKEYVWLNGGPTANGLGPDGDYFFAVLVPGGQPDPNDGGAKNLSDDFDAYTNRTFTVTGGEVSSYSGDHWLDSNTEWPNGCPTPKCGTPDGNPPYIRLFPYADTTNPGGVYIMAICSLDGGYPVDPRDCKYDAFKVKHGKTTYDFMLAGYKILDLGADGSIDGEPGLHGWEITIQGTGFLGEDIDATETTDSSGYWSYQSVEYSFTGGDQPQTAHLTVCETLQDGWVQSYPTPSCYTVDIDPEGVTFVDGLDFGNYPQGDVSGGKYYDTNENGQWDEGEPWLENWEITYDSSSVLTDADGMFMVTLDPGSYDFAEVQGANGWMQTGNTVDQSITSGGASVSLSGFTYTVMIPNDQPSTVDDLYFGNVCKIAPGGRTPGFWQNNNGQALLAAHPEWLAELRSLNLVDEQGNNFDPYTPEDVANWILSDAGQNMAWKLSSFVAADTLNVLAGFTDPTVYAYGETVGYWIDYGNTLLGLYPLTPPGADGRTEQTYVKDILDKVANNYSFVQPAPGTACGDPYQ